MNSEVFILIIPSWTTSHCVHTFHWLALGILLPSTTFAILLEPFLRVITMPNSLFPYVIIFLSNLLFHSIYPIPFSYRFLNLSLYSFFYFSIYFLQIWAFLTLTFLWCFPLWTCLVRSSVSQSSTTWDFSWSTSWPGFGKPPSTQRRTSWPRLKRRCRDETLCWMNLSFWPAST